MRSTLAIGSVIACCGCAAGPARQGELPAPAPKAVVDGFVLGQAVRCSWGLAEPCRFIGDAYQYGMGVPRDAKRARSYFRKACSLGSTEGCVMTGVMTIELGERDRFTDVFATWERACENGSYSGCHLAGITLVYDPMGLRTPRDVQRGRTYLTRACTARYLPACGMGAAITIEFKETSSYTEAHAQLLEVCKLRERESCHYLAQKELEGTFGARDERAARHHFWQACRDGWGASCSALAYMHAKGIGTPVNARRASELTAAACTLGYEPSCDVLRRPGQDLPSP